MFNLTKYEKKVIWHFSLTSGLSLEMATIISSPLTSFSQSSDSVSCRAVSYVCGPKTRWSANWKGINSQILHLHHDS